MKNGLLLLVLSLITAACNQHNLPAEAKDDRAIKVLKLAQQNLFNPDLLETDAWAKFEKGLASEKMQSLQGKDYEHAFNQLSESLPFTHFYIRYRGKKATTAIKKEQEAPFELREIDSETVLLHLRSFAADAPGMMKIVQEIREKNYENLIIDIRNNSGGTLDAAVVLGRFLTNKPIDAGTYITRGWFTEKHRLPTVEEIQSFPNMREMNFKGFNKEVKQPAFRMVLPGHNNPVFRGKVYLLTNRLSASASEPFADVLKRSGIATVIGETTAGEMLSAEWFQVNKDYRIFIPVTHYLNSEGLPLDKIGVQPDIITTSEQALEETLKQISAGK